MSGMTVRVLHHHEADGWWVESHDIEGWTVAGETYKQVKGLVEDRVSFALAAAAEDRGESFDDSRFARIALEHYVPASA